MIKSWPARQEDINRANDCRGGHSRIDGEKPLVASSNDNVVDDYQHGKNDDVGDDACKQNRDFNSSGRYSDDGDDDDGKGSSLCGGIEE